tara:strand:+ start:340 stop:525 length:186 start_codon:yes stop_codon:yes gene_type:complete
VPKTKTPKEEVNTTERKNEKKNGNNIQIVYYVQLLLGIRVRIIGRRRRERRRRVYLLSTGN